jgi:hypothetical protein
MVLVGRGRLWGQHYKRPAPRGAGAADRPASIPRGVADGGGVEA